VIVRPQVPPGLEWVRVEYESIRGLISTAWKAREGVLELTVGIPANVTATVGVPAAAPESVRGPDGAARPLRVEAGRAWFEVGSGTHRFVAAFIPKAAP
jgi:alpha-L-rhamnosidase